jgi:predicted GTPase
MQHSWTRLPRQQIVLVCQYTIETCSSEHEVRSSTICHSASHVAHSSQNLFIRSLTDALSIRFEKTEQRTSSQSPQSPMCCISARSQVPIGLHGRLAQDIVVCRRTKTHTSGLDRHLDRHQHRHEAPVSESHGW